MSPQRARGVVPAIFLIASMACGAPPAPRARDALATPLEIEAPSAAAFERARRAGLPIVLSIRAGWCHWCHVMEATTYRDPQVVALLRDVVFPWFR